MILKNEVLFNKKIVFNKGITEEKDKEGKCEKYAIKGIKLKWQT